MATAIPGVRLRPRPHASRHRGRTGHAAHHLARRRAFPRHRRPAQPFLDPVLHRLGIRLASPGRVAPTTPAAAIRIRCWRAFAATSARATSCSCTAAIRAHADGQPVILAVLPRLLATLRDNSSTRHAERRHHMIQHFLRTCSANKPPLPQRRPLRLPLCARQVVLGQHLPRNPQARPVSGRGRYLDLGCGQGSLFAWLLAARQQYRGRQLAEGLAGRADRCACAASN